MNFFLEISFYKITPPYSPWLVFHSENKLLESYPAKEGGKGGGWRPWYGTRHVCTMNRPPFQAVLGGLGLFLHTAVPGQTTGSG